MSNFPPPTPICEGAVLSVAPPPAPPRRRRDRRAALLDSIIALRPGQHIRVKRGARSRRGVSGTVSLARQRGGPDALRSYVAACGDIIIVVDASNRAGRGSKRRTA